jgi:hypothetical protein
MKFMKKRIIVSLFVLCFISLLQAQVILERTSSKLSFTVDAAGDDNASPTPGQQLNNFSAIVNNKGKMIVGVGVNPSATSSSQLELAATDKALVLNRVALTSVIDKTTVPDPIMGMIIYNTATAGATPNNVTPGVYYFNGSVWFRLSDIDTGIDTGIKLRDLQANVTSVSMSPAPANAHTTAALANFGSISITESGTYVFSLRLYGTTSNASTSRDYPRSAFYVYLVKNGTTKLDYSEVNVGLGPSGEPATYSINMIAPSLSVGDIISIRLGSFTGTPTWTWVSNVGMRANKTSLIYWKI